jgi:hypothetical protein
VPMSASEAGEVCVSPSSSESRVVLPLRSTAGISLLVLSRPASLSWFAAISDMIDGLEGYYVHVNARKRGSRAVCETERSLSPSQCVFVL